MAASPPSSPPMLFPYPPLQFTPPPYSLRKGQVFLGHQQNMACQFAIKPATSPFIPAGSQEPGKAPGQPCSHCQKSHVSGIPISFYTISYITSLRQNRML